MDEQLNHLSVRSILESIGKQVENNLFILIRIYPQIKFRLFRLKQEVYMMLLGHRIEVLHNLTGKSHHIDALHLHFHLLVLNLPEVEYLIDKTQHAVRIAFYHL